MASPRELLLVAVDMGLEMRGPWDARLPHGEQRFGNVSKALRNWLRHVLALGGAQTAAVALVSLGDAADAPTAFSRERDLVCATLDSLVPGRQADASAPLDLSNLFDGAQAAFDAHGADAQMIRRLLVVFARSDVVPIVSRGLAAHKHLLCDPRFRLDVLYVHRRAGEGGSGLLEGGNKVQAIYDFFSTHVTNSNSFVFEVAASPFKLHRSLALLLAHPETRGSLQACQTRFAHSPEDAPADPAATPHAAPKPPHAVAAPPPPHAGAAPPPPHTAAAPPPQTPVPHTAQTPVPHTAGLPKAPPPPYVIPPYVARQAAIYTAEQASLHATKVAPHAAEPTAPAPPPPTTEPDARRQPDFADVAGSC
ncbi:hypothetical protein M885DRAFT_623706 [Pelagophyceae sp. CCMP2097]|nr:hypothetical protein M885DRAFT_623706 [Pelagophyceae sp. CCMP2097]